MFIKVKVNLFLFLEDVWGSGCINPHFLDLGTSWRWVVSFMPWLPYPRGNRPRCPLHRRLGGPQSRSGSSGEKKNLAPCRDLNPCRPARALSLHIIYSRKKIKVKLSLCLTN
jgi:hypothetical protein